MISFTKWFSKNLLFRFYRIQFVGILLLFFIWLKLENEKIESLKQKLNYISNIVEQAIQRQDRILLENIANFALQDQGLKGVYLCSDSKLLYSLGDVNTCERLSQPNQFLEKIQVRNLNSISKAKLYFVGPRFIFLKEALGILIFILAYLGASIFQLKIISKKIKKDILAPLGEISSKNSVVIKEISEIIVQKEILKNNEIEIKILQSMHGQARQLSHDIRSPLAALKAVKETASENLTKDQNALLKISIDRITDIANSILPKNKLNSLNKFEVEKVFLWPVIDHIISEKKLQYSGDLYIEITSEFKDSVFLFYTQCDPVELARTLSNIIDNSIEARKKEQQIKINMRLEIKDSKICIKIKDNGKGIPKDYTSIIFNEGFTSGKSGGSGLGLHQAKKFIENCGGSIDVDSEIDKGTIVTITLNSSDKPSWLAQELNIAKNKRVVILDDEEMVFKAWQQKLKPFHVELNHFEKIADFEASFSKTNQEALFLVDYDLRQGENGLEIIKKFSIESRSILVTGNYEELKVRNESEALNVRILPKPLINEVQIIA